MSPISNPSTERRRAHALLTALADGDRAAFDPLFDLLWPAVSRFAARLLGESEAEDAAQEALLRVFARAGEFDRRRDAMAWVFGIVYWQCRTHRQRARRGRETALDASLAEPVENARDSEARMLVSEALEAARDVLGEVSPRDRETLLAAAGLGPRPQITAAAFRKRLERARRRLRSILGIHHGTF